MFDSFDPMVLCEAKPQTSTDYTNWLQNFLLEKPYDKEKSSLLLKIFLENT
jgi:hypothetical protein